MYLLSSDFRAIASSFCWLDYSSLLFNCPYCRKFLFKLPSTTPVYYSVLLQTYYKVLLRTTKYYTPVLLRTTKYYKSFQNEHFVRDFVNFQGTSFQNEHFVRGYLNFSSNKLPKRAFRAMLPTIFTEPCFKTSVSRDASDNFHRKSFQNDRFVRGFFKFSQNNASKTQSVTTPGQCAEQFLELEIWVAPATSKFAFHHSFGRPSSTKLREGCAGHFKICISPQFWTSDEHETTKGSREDPGRFAFHHSFGRPTSTKWREGCEGHVQNSHFITVLGVRRARSDERVDPRSKKIGISPQFLDVRRARSDERVVSRRCQPNPPGVKRRRNFYRSLDPQPFSAALLSTVILSSSSQHSHSQQFSAALQHSHSQQFSAALLSTAILSSHSQLNHVAVVRGCLMLLWSGVGGQLLSHHVAVVRGWWSTIVTSCCCGQGLVVSYWHVL